MDEPSGRLSAQIQRFLRKPSQEKLKSVRFRLLRLFRKRSGTISLPFGAKWVLEESALDSQLQSGSFETAETRFVEAFLRSATTVLDIGAHHGYYTLLASMLVGNRGRVFAFEPSPRERNRLERHVQINKCTNVVIEQIALGAETGEADLFLVDGAEDYCNSLRTPAINAPTHKVRVSVDTLDQFLIRNHIPDVDFIKLDVEGAELSVLKGASSLLTQSRPPVFMIEVYDIRTRPWGYAAREIIQHLTQHTYTWFRLAANGSPVPIEAGRDSLDANFVAVPVQRMQRFLESVKSCFQRTV